MSARDDDQGERRLSWLRPVWLPALVALAVLVSGGVFLDRLSSNLAEERLRAHVVAELSLIRSKLEGNITSNVQLVRGLVSVIATEPGMDQARFAQLAQQVFDSQTLLRSIAGAPDLVVRMTYPMAGNEKVIGFNYRTSADQFAAVERMRDTGQFVLAGPVDLVQGGTGFVGRFPVYFDTPYGKDFWGLVAAVIDTERLYRASGLLEQTLDIDIAITGKDATGAGGTRFFGPDLSGERPVQATATLPTGSWELSAAPRGGWGMGYDPWPLRAGLMIAAALILFPIIITGRLLGERQAHVRALRRREAEYERLSRRLGLALQTSRVGVWEMNLVTKAQTWDDRMNQLYGLAPDGGERSYSHWHGVLHPDDLPQAIRDFENGVVRGRYNSDFRTVHPDGSIHFIRSIGAVYEGDDGEERILGVNWDITADVSLTQALQAREAELEQLSQRLALALETSQVGVWELDPQSGVEHWDGRTNALMGLPDDGAPRNFAFWKAAVHPDDLKRAEADFAVMIETGRYQSDYRVCLPDGTIRHIRSIATRFDNPDGSHKVVGINWDVSRDVEMTEALRHAKELAEARNAELEQARIRIEHTAHHDSLTGLPNRRLLDRVLGEHAGAGASHPDGLALLHLDLDRFKQINDTLGHAAGDAVLVRAARVLDAEKGAADFVARVGGDEFVIVTSAAPGDAHLALLAERIIAAMHAPMQFMGQDCRCGVSIGIAVDRGATPDPQQLLVNADIALYRAKRQGRNRHEFFSATLQAEVIATKRLADEIVTGIERNEFVAFFQPQFDARTLDVVGVEALARWQHPRDGLLTPDRFLPVAEELNLVATIDQAILDQALAMLDRLEARGLHLPRASVNVSLRRLHDEGLIASLRQRAIPPGRISFELVESIYLDESDAVAAWNIDQLKELGIDIEIDDFGTGYASIVSLQKLRPNRLKIDRQLVDPIIHDAGQRQLLSSIVDIGKSMQIELVAEGVETTDHARILRELGVDILQGYAFARPLSGDALEDFLREQSWRQAS